MENDWLEIRNTYGEVEYARRSAIVHLKTTRNGKTQITLRTGAIIWSNDPLSLTYDRVVVPSLSDIPTSRTKIPKDDDIPF